MIWSWIAFSKNYWAILEHIRKYCMLQHGTFIARFKLKGSSGKHFCFITATLLYSVSLLNVVILKVVKVLKVVVKKSRVLILVLYNCSCKFVGKFKRRWFNKNNLISPFYIYCIRIRTHNHLVGKRTLDHLLYGWVFVYETSGRSNLTFRYCLCFEQGVPWHSGNYRV